MEERYVPVALEHQPTLGVDEPTDGAGKGLADPRALQILSTEHWSLLTARSLVYNEAFARAGMFLAFLSATLLVLGLIATASKFSDEFLVIAAIALGVDLFVGLATLGRIAAASTEDLRYLQGMNRLRHAYFELVPEAEPYFITTGYDDFESVASFYGPDSENALRSLLHGFTTTPGMVGVICCAVAGGLAGVVTLLLTHATVPSAAAAVIAFVALFVVVTFLTVRSIFAFQRRLKPMFPRPGAGAPPVPPPGA